MHGNAEGRKEGEGYAPRPEIDLTKALGSRILGNTGAGYGLLWEGLGGFCMLSGIFADMMNVPASVPVALGMQLQ